MYLECHNRWAFFWIPYWSSSSNCVPWWGYDFGRNPQIETLDYKLTSVWIWRDIDRHADSTLTSLRPGQFCFKKQLRCHQDEIHHSVVIVTWIVSSSCESPSTKKFTKQFHYPKLSWFAEITRRTVADISGSFITGHLKYNSLEKITHWDPLLHTFRC